MTETERIESLAYMLECNRKFREGDLTYPHIQIRSTMFEPITQLTVEEENNMEQGGSKCLTVRELIEILKTCPPDARVVKPHDRHRGLDDVTNVFSGNILFDFCVGSPPPEKNEFGKHEAFSSYETSEIRYRGKGVVLLSDCDDYYEKLLIGTKP